MGTLRFIHPAKYHWRVGQLNILRFKLDVTAHVTGFG
jgi:hypothetical protein